MSTEEENILIAEFMGAERQPYPDGLFKGQFGYRFSVQMPMTAPAAKDGWWWNEKNMKFHSSFDWLMPVVEKIQSIDITPPPNYTGYRIEIVIQGYVKISGFPMPTITTNVSVEGGLRAAVYKAVVQFIQWYNKNKTS